MAGRQGQSASDDPSRAATSQLPDGDAANEDMALDGDGTEPGGTDGDDQENKPWASEIAALTKKSTEQFETLLQRFSSTQGQANKAEQLAKDLLLAQAGRNNASAAPADTLADVDLEDPATIARVVKAMAKRLDDVSVSAQRQSQLTGAQAERQAWMTHFKPQLVNPADWPDIEQELQGVSTEDLPARFGEINRERSLAARDRAGEAALEKQPEKPAGAKREGPNTYDGATRGGRMGGSGGQVQIVALVKRYRGDTKGLQADPEYKKFVDGG